MITENMLQLFEKDCEPESLAISDKEYLAADIKILIGEIRRLRAELKDSVANLELLTTAGQMDGEIMRPKLPKSEA